ncbi:hypothetical protein Sya03_33600 [Spirilliplanes yamanashiensis]|uniref:Uncharacterized protein n=2 Tax=Spirilliplanes yamanashiensis TaxID=42233 RepID=A0A8J3Y8S2_9ACTN|nr:hypothetical protein Sya03_33600 [Spirilliplanes yamanashiensis]
MQFGMLAGQLVVNLPLVAVLVAGVVLLATRRAALPRRAVTFGVAGLGVLGAGVLANLLWSVAFPALITSDVVEVRSFGYLSAVAGFVLTAVQAAGVALLVAAAVSREPARA